MTPAQFQVTPSGAAGRNPSLRRQILTLLTVLLFLNIVAWGLGSAIVAYHPVLLGLAGLAYSLGLRHAFDVDHIAAIDNVTRKLCLSGQQPAGVGFFFALGHSTIVIVLSAVVAVAADYAKAHMSGLGHIGALVSTTVSAGFLTLLGLVNLIVLWRLIRIHRAGATHQSLENGSTTNQVEHLLKQRGFLARLFHFLFRRVNRSWHMYPIGVLFGLGFATATESTILGTTAAMATHSALPFWQIMVFPLLFTAGMTLMDTLDSLVMLRAYQWAMNDQRRRLSFNIAITGFGVMLALAIGTLEWLQILAPSLNLSGAFWSWIDNIPFGTVGLTAVFMMLATWLFAAIWYRRRFTSPAVVAE